MPLYDSNIKKIDVSVILIDQLSRRLGVKFTVHDITQD